MTSINGYVAINKKTYKLQGIDMASGGYPYDTDNIQSAKIWESEEEAMKYISMFSNDLTPARIFIMYECQILET